MIRIFSGRSRVFFANAKAVTEGISEVTVTTDRIAAAGAAACIFEVKGMERDLSGISDMRRIDTYQSNLAHLSYALNARLVTLVVTATWKTGSSG